MYQSMVANLGNEVYYIGAMQIGIILREPEFSSFYIHSGLLCWYIIKTFGLIILLQDGCSASGTECYKRPFKLVAFLVPSMAPTLDVEQRQR